MAPQPQRGPSGSTQTCPSSPAQPWRPAITWPRITLADTTAIGFTTPLFIMIGAYVVFKEPMRWERWVATLVGFAGVLIVVGASLLVLRWRRVLQGLQQRWRGLR